MMQPWNDGKPGSPSSLDVLVRWLMASSNYKRWQSSPKRVLCQEIVGEFEKQGAPTRSVSAIRKKINKLEHEYSSAASWLKDAGQLERFNDGKADEAVIQGVHQRCSLFRELTPVFQSTNSNSAQSNGGDIDDCVQTAVAEESSTEVIHTSADNELKSAILPGGLSQRKRAPDTLEPDSSLIKRGKQETLQPQGAMQVDPDPPMPSHGQTFGFTEHSMALTEFFKGNESRWNEYYGIKNTFGLDEPDDKRSQQLHQFEIEHANAIAKLQLEEKKAEQQRQQMR
ncbi:unnamed protein product [Phytophthora lilii]|uniref:Unnamed protein product n=1 Tax=Phytophthora lilii TaxID=2077276 RepID=A0A9W6TGY4_9STRA|nr:unnamed protein product [Phytophthora lilii]